MQTIKVEKIDHHRNGVGGLGFHVVLFKDLEEKRNMMAVVFPRESNKGAGGVLCAAFDLALLAEGIIEFGHNSWRGDQYAVALYPEIEKWESEREARFSKAQSATNA